MTWRPSPFTSHHGSWQANKLTDCQIIFCVDCKKIIASTIHAVIQYKKFTDWELRILFPKDAPFYIEFIQSKHAFLPADCYVLFKLNQIKCHCCILNKCTIRQHIHMCTAMSCQLDERFELKMIFVQKRKTQIFQHEEVHWRSTLHKNRINLVILWSRKFYIASTTVCTQQIHHNSNLSE